MVLENCESPETLAMASVWPCVGLTELMFSGIQSIWFPYSALLKLLAFICDALVTIVSKKTLPDFHAVREKPRHGHCSKC